MKLYQVDAFTDTVFSGNPAGVMLLKEFLDTELMQKIAMEMNVSETAFIKDMGLNIFEVRFFTPSEEVDLCGHATLSCAHILFSKNIVPSGEKIVFHAKGGELVIQNTQDGYAMEFPLWEYHKVDDIKNAQDISGIQEISEVYDSDMKWKILVIDSIKDLQNLEPNFSKMKGTAYGNIAVTCKGEGEYDYFMRCFVTDCGINEDPVTGSIECILAPLWAEKIGKNHMKSFQSSFRGGEKFLELRDNSVVISGNAVTVGEVNLFI